MGSLIFRKEPHNGICAVGNVISWVGQMALFETFKITEAGEIPGDMTASVKKIRELDSD